MWGGGEGGGDLDTLGDKSGIGWWEVEVIKLMYLGHKISSVRDEFISVGWNRESSTVYRGVLISGDWNRESSTVYRGVLISGDWNRDGFHCTH